MKKAKKELTPLYIEDLGRVQGGKGGKMTTLAIGEEDPVFTTLAIGEECDATTLAIGEEDVATTLAIGEEDGGI